MNDTVVNLPYAQHNFSSMKLHLWGRLQKFNLVNPLPFALRIVMKDPFFITCNNIFEKQVTEREFVEMDMQTYLFFSLRVRRSQIPSLYIFLIFFKGWQIMDWYVLSSRVNSQVFCMDYIPPIFWKHLDWASWFGFISQWRIART